MTAYDEQRLAELIKALPPAPQAWVEAAQVLPPAGAYHDTKEPGVYRCAACGAELFRSETKYDSGTGWPSFYEPASEESVETERDWALVVPRTEVHCASCGGHLGHVFGDGPAPTGLRYCINSAALDLARTEGDTE